MSLAELTRLEVRPNGDEWTVWGYYPEGLIYGFKNLPTQEEAMEFAEEMLDETELIGVYLYYYEPVEDQWGEPYDLPKAGRERGQHCFEFEMLEMQVRPDGDKWSIWGDFDDGFSMCYGTYDTVEQTRREADVLVSETNLEKWVEYNTEKEIKDNDNSN